MKVYIESHGDPDVGISGGYAEVDLFHFPFVDNAERELARELLAKAFSELWDDKAIVRFEHELDDEPEYDDDGMSDVEADAQTLAMAGWGTDEDYGHFGGDYE